MSTVRTPYRYGSPLGGARAGGRPAGCVLEGHTFRHGDKRLLVGAFDTDGWTKILPSSVPVLRKIRAFTEEMNVKNNSFCDEGTGFNDPYGLFGK